MEKSERPLLTKELLVKMYEEQREAIVAIVRKTGWSEPTIRHALKKFGIPYRKKIGEKLSKQYLQAEYVEKGRNTCEIAEEIGIHPGSVARYLNKYGLGCRYRGHHRWGGAGEVSGHYINSLRQGAKKRHIEWDLDKEFLWDLYLGQERKCALSGIPIVFPERRGPQNLGTASLDRIDSNLGYVPTNVQWVHKTIQKMKMDLPEEEFIIFCHHVATAHPLTET